MRDTSSTASFTITTTAAAAQVGATSTAARYGMNAIDPRAFLAKTNDSISASNAKAEKNAIAPRCVDFTSGRTTASAVMAPIVTTTIPETNPLVVRRIGN